MIQAYIPTKLVDDTIIAAVNVSFAKGNMVKLPTYENGFAVHEYQYFGTENFREFYPLHEQGAFLENFIGWIVVPLSKLDEEVPNTFLNCYKLDEEGVPTQEIKTLKEWLKGCYTANDTEAIFPTLAVDDDNCNKRAPEWNLTVALIDTYGNDDLSNVYNYQDGLAKRNEMLPQEENPEEV
jgi:hypothetical protein